MPVRRIRPRRLPVPALLLLMGCAEAPSSGPCRTVQANTALPRDVWESSGLALSRRSPGVLWTHNDSGHEPWLFAIDSAGRALGRVRVTGAELLDWEDLAAGPCEIGDCLFVGDIGDNPSRKESISIYVVPEPLPGDSATLPATRLNLRYPDGPRDAEAMFILPTGDLYIISKGRRDSLTLYRLPKNLQRPDTTATMERLRTLGPPPRSGQDRVTGAGASPDGLRVAVRTYRTVAVFTTIDLLENRGPFLTVDTRALSQRVGESVALGADGTLWLSSEGSGGRPPQMARLACLLPAP